jgi:hypothetical protein
MKKMLWLLAALYALANNPAPLLAQTTTTQTTLSSAVTTGTATTFALTSTSGFTASTLTQATRVVVDGEMATVQSVNTTANTITVSRGTQGRATPHASGAIVYFGNAGSNGPFIAEDPVAGSTCTSTQYPYLPVVRVDRILGGSATSRVWNCINSTWMRDDGYYFVPPGGGTTTVSGNSTGTNGLTTAGSVPVIQAQTSATGTNTHTYTFSMAPPSRLNLRGVVVRDVVFAYGVQSASMGTQAATLASGTMNSTTVFTAATYPTPAASETQSSAAARADAGTLVITPVVASFNNGTTTAGQFFSAKFAPATPFQIATDLKQYWFNVTLQMAATTATITNSPGILVHYAYLPD